MLDIFNIGLFIIIIAGSFGILYSKDQRIKSTLLNILFAVRLIMIVVGESQRMQRITSRSALMTI